MTLSTQDKSEIYDMIIDVASNILEIEKAKNEVLISKMREKIDSAMQNRDLIRNKYKPVPPI